MKPTSILLPLLTLTAVLLSGCGANAEHSTMQAPAFGESDNEILTYQKPDPNKTQLVISGLNNTHLIEAFEAKHPDIQIISMDITLGDDSYRPVHEWIDAGLAPDVLFLGAGLVKEDFDYFTDLTSKEYTSHYDAETLLTNAKDGHVTLLPGPLALSGILFNKTMFDQYGWSIPQTQEEFFALCDQIWADTNGTVTPFNPNAKYEKEFASLLEAMTYPQILGGSDNRAWLHAFQAGTDTMTGHMEPLYDLARQLAFHGLLTEDSFTYSQTTRLKEFAAGKIAMVNDYVTNTPTDSKYEFSIMPYPGQIAQDGMLMRISSYWVGIPKGERPEAVQKAADALMHYLSSSEGQTALIGDRAFIGSTTDSNIPNTPVFKLLGTVISSGKVASPEYFALNDIPPAKLLPVFTIRTSIQSMIAGEKTPAQAIQFVDDTVAQARSGQDKPQAILAKANEDFTILETSNLFADMFRKKLGADVGLVLNNVAYRGNVMRIFSGDLTPNKIKYLKPRSLDNHSTLMKATMTGKQLKEALNHPKGQDDTLADCVYAVSGLKASYAPWGSPGTKVLSVSFEHGAPIDDTKKYSVAFWLGSVNESYYDTASAERAEGTFEEILSAYLMEQKSISPAHDGRITLVWH